jgi:hypothetical protein
MNHARLLELFWEFSRHLEAQSTLYLDSAVGYSILHERLQEYQDSTRRVLGDSEYGSEAFQDTCSMLYKHISNCDYTPVSMSPVMKQGEMKSRLKQDGRNALLLGQQCIVSVYAYWEEYLRIEIGKAIGVLPADATQSEETRKVLNQHVADDLWGDIRHIRNGIVHANGIATAEIQKCKLIKWFRQGETIDLTFERMRALFLALAYYRNKIHDMALPKRNFRIPTSQQ